jgi:hypothetical protein
LLIARQKWAATRLRAGQLVEFLVRRVELIAVGQQLAALGMARQQGLSCLSCSSVSGSGPCSLDELPPLRTCLSTGGEYLLRMGVLERPILKSLAQAGRMPRCKASSSRATPDWS